MRSCTFIVPLHHVGKGLFMTSWHFGKVWWGKNLDIVILCRSRFSLHKLTRRHSPLGGGLKYILLTLRERCVLHAKREDFLIVVFPRSTRVYHYEPRVRRRHVWGVGLCIALGLSTLKLTCLSQLSFCGVGVSSDHTRVPASQSWHVWSRWY